MKPIDPEHRERRETLYGHGTSVAEREAALPRAETPEKKLRVAQRAEQLLLQDRRVKAAQRLRRSHAAEHARDYANQRELPDQVVKKHEKEFAELHAKHEEERREQARQHREQRDALRARRAAGSGRPAA